MLLLKPAESCLCQLVALLADLRTEWRNMLPAVLVIEDTLHGSSAFLFHSLQVQLLMYTHSPALLRLSSYSRQDSLRWPLVLLRAKGQMMLLIDGDFRVRNRIRPQPATVRFGWLMSTLWFDALRTVFGMHEGGPSGCREVVESGPGVGCQLSHSLCVERQPLLLRQRHVMNANSPQIAIIMDISSKEVKEVSAKLRSIVRLGTAVNKWKKLAGRSRDRYYRLRELVTTEEDYRKDLISIKERIQQPLVESQCITANEAAAMFPNVESMIGLSIQLREELNAKFEGWDRRKTLIGQTMIRFSKFLLVYSDYFKNFNQSQRKLKQLLAENGGARLIQKKLSTETRIITFEDLMSKPFQRPLKYHLILRDYASKIEKTHPDWQPLQEAIECYHRVNQQNNLSLENKEKDQMLMVLDARFGGIIQAQARYFVKEYEAIYIDTACTLYVLSDMAIVAYKGTNSCLKIAIDKYSHVERAPSGRAFVNRLFLFGKYICVHLSFFDAATADQVFVTMTRLINDTNQNEASREEMINLRTTRQSLVERRRSYTNLEPQFKRPLVIRVLGCEKRHFSEDKAASFFVIEFEATPPKVGGPPSPRQYSYVRLETLLQIQSLGKTFYKEEEFANMLPLLSRTKDMTEYEYKKNDGKRLELQAVFIALFLNSIYRNPKILKRIDLPSYLLKLSEPLWLHLNEHYQCPCSSCMDPASHGPYESHIQYFRELDDRQHMRNKMDSSQKGGLLRRYCDLRTIAMQQMLTALPAERLIKENANLKARIAWVKAQLGWINHVYTTPRPQFKPITIDIFLSNVHGEECLRLDVYPSWRVRQVMDLVARRLDQQVEDYSLALWLNGRFHLMLDDEPIGDALTPPKEEGGILNFFFKGEEYRPMLYLRKAWTLEYEMERAQEGGKLVLCVEEIIFRLRKEQVRLGVEESIAIYAFYYAFRHFIELDTITLAKLKMKNEEFSRFVAPSLKSSSFYDQVFRIIERLKQDKTLLSARMITERIIEFLSNKPGWSSHMFPARLAAYGKDQGVEVKIGCDLSGLKVQEKNKVSLLYDFRMEDPTWSIAVNGFELIVRQENQYCFIGRDLWKVKRQLDFYRLYRQAFIKEK